MSYEITFEKMPAGYSVNSARSGENVTVCLRDFVSSEDGDELITKLEGLPQQILSMVSHPILILPSAVHTLLAIIRKNKTATVYLNEVKPIEHIRPKISCKKGELITSNHILDMGRIEFQDVDIPGDAGVVYVFSIGWRKGFFYDLFPLHDKEGKPRDYDLEERIGSLYSYLIFQERFKIDETTWRNFFVQRWFPFVYLDNDLLREMISHAREGWQIDDLLPKISANVKRLLNDSPLTAKTAPAFAEHSEILTTAIERYLAADYISCASILYTRIEGLLRSFYSVSGDTSQFSTSKISKVAVNHHQASRITNSLLLPAKFNEYIDTVYFANFSPGSAPYVGRHSVAHGEARSDDFSLKSTTIGLLIVYQLSLFFSDGAGK